MPKVFRGNYCYASFSFALKRLHVDWICKVWKVKSTRQFPCLIFLFCTRGKTLNGELANTFYKLNLNLQNYIIIIIMCMRVCPLTHKIRYFPFSNSHQPLTWVKATDLNTKYQLSKLGFTVRLHTSWWLLKTLVAAPSVVRQSISHDFFAISA